MADTTVTTSPRHPNFAISMDRSALDVDAIHAFLSTSYWSPGVARERVERAIEHSLCLGLYDLRGPRAGSRSVVASGDRDRPLAASTLAGFARVITDQASFAYLCDVFVLEAYRGQGLSKWLMEVIMATPAITGIRRFCLMTRDAHTLYERFGFQTMADPSKYLEIVDREGYKRP